MKNTMLLLVALIPSVATASDKSDLINQAMSESLSYLALTHVCSSAVGDGHFQLARTLARDVAIESGVTRDEATIAVAAKAEEIKRDPRQINDAGTCMSLMNEQSHKIEVLRAKVRQSRSK